MDWRENWSSASRPKDGAHAKIVTSQLPTAPLWWSNKQQRTTNSSSPNGVSRSAGRVCDKRQEERRLSECSSHTNKGPTCYFSLDNRVVLFLNEVSSGLTYPGFISESDLLPYRFSHTRNLLLPHKISRFRGDDPAAQERSPPRQLKYSWAKTDQFYSNVQGFHFNFQVWRKKGRDGPKL